MRVVATAGHVDHGKSTLLRALTGMEPDRWEEERRRGLTIDLGFVWTRLTAEDGTAHTVAFVDVPGHERFIPNMLAGVGAVPLALFVVAADDGWSAQSQEHLDILDLLGIPIGVVAITKSKTVPRMRSEQVAGDVARRVRGTDPRAPEVLEVDSIAGTGLGELGAVLAARLSSAPPAADRGRPRLWVDRSFTITGAGTVVTGTLVDGALETGQEVALLPGARIGRVRTIQLLGEPAERAGPGSRVALNLAGIDRDEVARGAAVVGLRGRSGRAALTGWRATTEIDAWVRALPGVEIGRRGAWLLHAGSAETAARLSPLLGEPVVAGRPGHVRIRLQHPLALVTGDRFVLREAGRRTTAGGGEVLDPAPPGAVRGPDARLERALQLDRVREAAHPPDRLVALVAGAGGARPWDEAHAAAGTHPDEPLPDGMAPIGDRAVQGAALERWSDAVRSAAADQHRADPAGPGPGREMLARAARAAGAPRTVAGTLPDELVDRGVLVRSGSGYVLPEHAEATERGREQREDALLAALDAQPFTPPPLDEAAQRTGVPHEEVHHLVQRNRIVVCGPVAFSAAAVAEAVRRLEQLEREHGRFTTAQARERLGTSRRFVIPLLEHLDAAGITEFDGSTRRVREATAPHARGT